MSSRFPAVVSFSLEQLVAQGGDRGTLGDGWGIAYFEGTDARLIREPEPAAGSEWVRFIEAHDPLTTLVLSHIRAATIGVRALRNTQPFARVLSGRKHVFAHNGHLEGVAEVPGLDPGPFLPIGETDSEIAFCALLRRMRPLWRDRREVPALEDRMQVFAGFARDAGALGPANFLYSDGDALFIHGNRRRQPADGRIAPPGLHLLQRRWSIEPLAAPGFMVGPPREQQRLVLVASVPLTGEEWTPLEEGEVVAIADGRIAAREAPAQTTPGSCAPSPSEV